MLFQFAFLAFQIFQLGIQRVALAVQIVFLLLDAFFRLRNFFPAFLEFAFDLIFDASGIFPGGDVGFPFECFSGEFCFFPDLCSGSRGGSALCLVDEGAHDRADDQPAEPGSS